ncbi:MAG: hypothetical protein HOM11_08690 [Methylococcales bacterium]|jgi:hypothetical protein|nr:hypothetical protein [Methylococcales bacterium]
MENLEEILIEIQDKLVPILDDYEQAIYHYLFRHTYLIGKKSCLYSTRAAKIGLGSGEKSKQPSTSTRSKKLRSLEDKGCVQIIERSNKGIVVKLLLPSQIPHIQNQAVEEELLVIDELDFYKDRRLLGSLLAREDNRCFYTGRKITSENCYLDHVIPQASGGGNSFKNIVATCYDANSMKNDKPASEFIRSLYKDELISLLEFKKLKDRLIKLKAGELKPDLELINSAIYS